MKHLPWNNWFHCCGSTYGTWLRGDPRGWRSRHHREHVDGDYKSPPPKGKYDRELKRSQRLMKRQRVELTREQRRLACKVFGDKLRALRVELVELCVGKKHWHLLARFDPRGALPSDPERTPKRLIGQAKGASARALSKAGVVPIGGVWALRCKCKPITCRAHQVNVRDYVRDHEKKGAAVYSRLVRSRSQG